LQEWRAFVADDNNLFQLCAWVRSQQGKAQMFLRLIISFLENHSDSLMPFEVALMTQFKAFLSGRYIDTTTARDGFVLASPDRLRLTAAWMIASQLSTEDDLATVLQEIKNT
jgi:hypothetical protein